MNKIKAFALGLAAVGVIGSSSLMAASQTHDLAVSASVNASCKFSDSGPTALAFGPIDPTGSVDATASANVTFRCTKGTTSSIASEVGVNDSGGAHRVKSGTDFMVYTVSYGGTDAQVGTGHGAAGDLTLAVSGKITAAQYQNAPALSYTDTLTLTIAP